MQVGYDSLAAHMAAGPSLLIFRRFATLHARNLLFYQAQIVEKERQLLENIASDRNSDSEERRSFAFNFRAMLESELDKEESEIGQKDIALELRPLLKEYGEALLLLKQLFELPPVDTFDLKALRRVMCGRGKAHFLKASEAKIWTEEYKPDLTSLLSRRKEMDTVSNWLSWFRTGIFHKYWGQKWMRPLPIPAIWAPEYSTPMRCYSEESSSGIVNVLRTILGPGLPTASALCLFFINDSIKQMGIVVLSSFLFSTLLALLTAPAKTETFVATATFTAVLVVFVGSNAQNPTCQC